MICVYINYPNSHFRIHLFQNCNKIQQHNKVNQRVLLIDNTNVSKELRKFLDGNYTFSSTASENDMWLEVDFEDIFYELSFAFLLHKILGAKYRPILNAPIEIYLNGNKVICSVSNM